MELEAEAEEPIRLCLRVIDLEILSSLLLQCVTFESTIPFINESFIALLKLVALVLGNGNARG